MEDRDNESSSHLPGFTTLHEDKDSHDYKYGTSEEEEMMNIIDIKDLKKQTIEEGKSDGEKIEEKNKTVSIEKDEKQE